jgi:hypothetical protein
MNILDDDFIFNGRRPAIQNEYLLKVEKAILKNKLSVREANMASRTTTGEFGPKLHKQLPFDSYIIDGIIPYSKMRPKIYAPAIAIVRLKENKPVE